MRGAVMQTLLFEPVGHRRPITFSPSNGSLIYYQRMGLAINAVNSIQWQVVHVKSLSVAVCQQFIQLLK